MNNLPPEKKSGSYQPRYNRSFPFPVDTDLLKLKAFLELEYFFLDIEIRSLNYWDYGNLLAPRERETFENVQKAA